MEVIDKRYIGKVRFNTLSLGAPFVYNDVCFIRTEKVSDFNAVNLETGYCVIFKEDDWVDAVKAKIVIKSPGRKQG